MVIFVKLSTLGSDWNHDNNGIAQEFGSVETFKELGLVAISDATDVELVDIEVAVNSRRQELNNAPLDHQLKKELFDLGVACCKARELDVSQVLPTGKS